MVQASCLAGYPDSGRSPKSRSCPCGSWLDHHHTRFMPCFIHPLAVAKTPTILVSGARPGQAAMWVVRYALHRPNPEGKAPGRSRRFPDVPIQSIVCRRNGRPSLCHDHAVFQAPTNPHGTEGRRRSSITCPGLGDLDCAFSTRHDGDGPSKYVE